ncbi:MAG TPA: trigger factor [Candidatus Tripitaka californicus]|uniref:trigger factor n=1 Tax=Candidatus Tripitaka californicus TaxID=3367616 RepID=UPI004026E6C6
MEKVAPNFNVTVEEIGPCKKRLKVEVPRENVEEELKKRLEELKGSLALPGFRKGKAPKGLIERQFSKQVQEDVRNSLLSNFYQQAIEQNKLEPIGEPEFDNIDFDTSKPLNFQVTFEVKPSFELEGYKGLQLKKKSGEVTPEELQSALSRVGLSRMQLVSVEGGEVLAQDQVLCDYRVEVEGKTVSHEEEAALWVSGQRVGTLPVPDLTKLRVGARAGETKEVKVNLGSKFQVAEYRNKEGTLRLSIKEIKRPTVPELNDALAKQMNFPSLEKLKEAVGRQLEVEKKRWVEQDLQNQVFAQLLEMAKFDLPKDWIQRQTVERLYRYQLELLQKGVPLEDIEKEGGKLKDASEGSVISDLKISLLLGYIADKERVYATENDLEIRINEMARSYGTTAAKIRRHLEKQGAPSALRHQIREDKVIKLLLKEANITVEEPRVASVPGEPPTKEEIVAVKKE